MASELEQVKAECVQKDRQLRDTKTKLSEYNPHNVRRRLQRKDTKIASQKENIKKLEKDVKSAQKVGAKRAQSQLRYHNMKHKELNDKLKEENSCEYCLKKKMHG